MSRPYRGVAAAALAMAIAGSPPADAQDDGVFAIVNGDPITANEVALAAEDLGSDLERIPAQLRATVVVDLLINQRLFADLARNEGVEDSEVYRQRLAYFTAQALRDSYVETVLIDKITDADVEARYESEIAELPGQEEVRARHILVETELKAKALSGIARTGADFAELAAANSTGPSAPRGGDLDYFTADGMVSEFSEVAFTLGIGEISDPVRTEYGWHVIKVEDRRVKPPPPLETVYDHIKALVLRDLIRTETEVLREAAEIEYPHETAEDPAAGGGDAPAAAQ